MWDLVQLNPIYTKTKKKERKQTKKQQSNEGNDRLITLFYSGSYCRRPFSFNYPP